MVYYIGELEQTEDALFEQLLPYVSSERMARIEKYRFRSDRIQSVLAFVLLRIALKLEYGCIKMPRLASLPTGKPYFADMPKIHFNLSHCKKGVACGISDQPLGVDIQNYVPFKEKVAKRFMSEAELTAVKAGDADKMFTQLWTVKESYGKCLGRGVCCDMPRVKTDNGVFADGHLCQSYALENFVISVCAEKELDLKRLCTPELPELCRMLETRYL